MVGINWKMRKQTGSIGEKMLTSYFPPHSLSANWPCLRANRSAQFRRRSNTRRRKNKRALFSRYRRTANTEESQISRWKSIVPFPLLELSRNNKTGPSFFQNSKRFESSRTQTDLSNNDDSKRTSISQRSREGKVHGGAKSGWAKWQANFARFSLLFPNVREIMHPC